MVMFWISALAMAVVAVGFVLLPLFVGRGAKTSDRDEVNVALYEERLAELETQLADGSLESVEYGQMKTELQKNLLSDTDESKTPDAVSPASLAVGKLPVILALLIPTFAFFAYADFGLSWGALTDLEVSQELKNNDLHGGSADPAAMHETVAKLAKSLATQPDNHEGWYMLAQSYLNINEYEKAAAVFKKLFDTFPGDAGLASYYAEALFLADDRDITERVSAAIDATLKLNPHDITMLEIKGMDAFLKGRLQESFDNFSKALTTAEGRRAELIRQAIERVEVRMGKAPGSTRTTPAVENEIATSSKPGPASKPVNKTSVQNSRTIQVLVELAGDLDVSLNDSVFVFARAVTGPPMPLAVQRMTVAGLPTLVKLDESMAMMQGMGLANFDSVQVVARISSSGIANVSPDDYEAKSGSIDLTRTIPVIKLKIEKRVRDQ